MTKYDTLIFKVPKTGWYRVSGYGLNGEPPSITFIGEEPRPSLPSEVKIKGKIRWWKRFFFKTVPIIQK